MEILRVEDFHFFIRISTIMARYHKLLLNLGMFGLLLGFGWFSLNVSANSPALFAWQIQVIDSANNVGQSSSLALHPTTEKPYISYYDGTTKDLKLAFPVTSGGDCGPGNSWSCNSLTFQNNVDFGSFSSLTFNSLGQWGITYSDNTNGTNAFRGIPAPGGTELFWSTIDDTGVIAFLNASGLDLNEKTHVSYAALDLQTSKAYIKHAEYVGNYGNCGNNAWRCDTIVETSLAGFGVYNALFFTYNLPNIVYRDINQHLSIATYIGYNGGNCGPDTSWICLGLDTTTIVDGFVSVYKENANFVGITYLGNDHLLHYAEYVSSGGNCGTGLYLNAFRCISIEAVGSPNSGQIMGASVGRSNEVPVIAYNDTDDQGNSILKIAYRKFFGNCGPMSGFFYTWQCDVIDDGSDVRDVGYYPSLKVDSEGNVHIAYFDYTNFDLKYAFSDTPIGPTPTPSPTNTPPPNTAFPVYLPLLLR